MFIHLNSMNTQNADKNPAKNTAQREVESQLQRTQRISIQQAMATGQLTNALNRPARTPVPFALLLSYIKPYLDHDRAMQLQALYVQLLSNTINEEEFVRRLRSLVGDHMVNMAVYKLQQEGKDSFYQFQLSFSNKSVNNPHNTSQAMNMQNVYKNLAQNAGYTQENESHLQTMQRMNNQQAMAAGKLTNAVDRPAGMQVPFALLLPVIESQLDRDRAMQLQGLYFLLRSNSINKEEFVQHFRSLVGDHMLKMAVYKLQQQKEDAPADPTETEDACIQNADDVRPVLVGEGGEVREFYQHLVGFLQREAVSDSQENKDTENKDAENKDTDTDAIPGTDKKKRKRKEKPALEGTTCDIGPPVAQKMMMESFYALRTDANASTAGQPHNVAAVTEPSSVAHEQGTPKQKRLKQVGSEKEQQVGSEKERKSKKTAIAGPVREEDEGIASLNCREKLVNVDDDDNDNDNDNDEEFYHEVHDDETNADVEGPLLHKPKHKEPEVQQETAEVGGSDPPDEEGARLNIPDLCREWLAKGIPGAEMAFLEGKNDKELDDEIALSLAALNTRYAEIRRRSHLQKEKLAQVIQSHRETNTALQEARKAVSESESMKERLAELEREVAQGLEEKRVIEERLEAVSKQWEDEKVRLTSDHDKKHLTLNQENEALTARAVKAEADAEALRKDLERMKGDKKWLLEEGLRLAFEKVKVSADYVKKLTTLTVAADALGRSEGLLAGYNWAKKGESLETLPRQQSGSERAMMEAYAGFAGMTPSIFDDLAALSEDDDLTKFRRLLLPPARAVNSTSSASGSSESDESGDEE